MIALVLAAAIAACSPALSDAALHELSPHLGFGVNSFGVYLGQETPESLSALSSKVAAYRKRVAKIADPCSRAAYVEWLDWYDGEITEARTELTDHHQAREMADYRAQRRKELDAAKAAHIEKLP